VSSGYGTPDFDKGMLKAQGIYELADKSLIPDAALQQNKLVDRAYAAVAEHQAGIDPRGVLDQIAKTGKLKYTINGNEGDAIADPQLAQHIKNVAIQALNFNQSQADHTTRLDLARIKAEGDQVEAGATLGIINGEPNAMRAAVESVDTVHKRVLLDGSAQRSLYNFKLAVDKERAEGPSVSDPVAYGKAVSDIENLRVTNPLSVMTLPLLTFNDRARLTTSMMSLQHKMKDDEYAAHRIKRKEGEDTLRADLKAKDPSTAWGEVNPKAEILVTQYRQRLDSEEARVRATGGKGWNTLNPLKTATEVMNENAETIAKDFRQGATKIIGTLGQFVPPPGTQVTYKRMHDNIEKSPLLPNEKLMFHALTNQMYAQGITAEKIDSTIRGADIKDETQQANWLMRLYQGMTQSAQP
jgi:hypothetical protein